MCVSVSVCVCLSVCVCVRFRPTPRLTPLASLPYLYEHTPEALSRLLLLLRCTGPNKYRSSLDSVKRSLEDWMRFTEMESEMVSAFCCCNEVNHCVNEVPLQEKERKRERERERVQLPHVFSINVFLFCSGTPAILSSHFYSILLWKRRLLAASSMMTSTDVC